MLAIRHLWHLSTHFWDKPKVRSIGKLSDFTEKHHIWTGLKWRLSYIERSYVVRAYYTDQWSMCLLLNSNDEIKHEARRDTWPYRGIRHSSRVWMGSCIIRGRLWFVLPHGVTGWAMPGNCGGTDGLTQKKRNCPGDVSSVVSWGQSDIGMLGTCLV